LTARKQPTVPTVVNLDRVQRSEPPQSAQLQCFDRQRAAYNYGG